MLFHQPKGERLPKEVALQQELHKSETCPYIVKILDRYLEDQLIMTMEYPRPCMTLHAFIQCHPSLPRETLARRLMSQAVTAAKYWIGHGVNHGDLSWDNFLINTDMMQVKIIDFGNGRLITTTNNLESGYCGEFLCFYSTNPRCDDTFIKTVAKPSFAL
ncbi:MAG: protein kinase domain-containing protein [Plesiomonas sp.]|uniref:protein kinase domain-containing protein n=1 Tax=Plesiomonas sp. TaxID=2486279 RepID=UPI003F3F0F87